MFLAHCRVCRRDTLLGVDEVDYVHTLVPGLISVTGTCPRGHLVVILTGRGFDSRQPSPGATADPVPPQA